MCKSKQISGYQGIGPNSGEFVPLEDAFQYVADAVGIKKFDETAPDAAEFKEMLVEWFFSGNWIEVEGSDDGER